MNFLGYVLQIIGLVIGFFGTLILALKEIKTKEEITQLAGTYWNRNPHQEKELTEKSQFAKFLAFVLTISFLLQAIGLALSEVYA